MTPSQPLLCTFCSCQTQTRPNPGGVGGGGDTSFFSPSIGCPSMSGRWREGLEQFILPHCSFHWSFSTWPVIIALRREINLWTLMQLSTYSNIKTWTHYFSGARLSCREHFPWGSSRYFVSTMYIFMDVNTPGWISKPAHQKNGKSKILLMFWIYLCQLSKYCLIVSIVTLQLHCTNCLPSSPMFGTEPRGWMMTRSPMPPVITFLVSYKPRNSWKYASGKFV